MLVSDGSVGNLLFLMEVMPLKVMMAMGLVGRAML